MFKYTYTSVNTLVASAKRVVTTLARTSLPEIMLITTYIISRYLTNADFSYPYELVMPIALLAVIITMFFYAYRWVFGRVLTAHIAALPLAYSLYHFGDLTRASDKIFRPLLPANLETSFTLGLLSILGAALVYGLIAYSVVRLAGIRPHWSIDLQLTKIALFIISFNFFVQIVVIGNFWFQARHQLAYEYKAPALAKKPGAVIKKPDIYYLLFDRYAGAETLKDIYGYDNSGFEKFLEDEDFVTRQQAFANYPYTMASVGSTLAMDYSPQLARFSDDKKQTGFPYRAILNNPPVVSALRANGYDYNLLSSWWDFARIGVKADYEPTKSFRLRLFGFDFYQSDFSRDIINRTALSPLVKKGIGIGDNYLVKYDLDRNPRENFESQMSTLKQLAGEDKQNPQFTFAHVLMPHDPYIFDANGKETTYSRDRNDQGADEYVKYTNQVTYANTRLKEVITLIKAKNPQAVIILQSDEGPYPKQFRGSLTPRRYFDPKNLPVDQMRQKMSIQTSYYFPGVDKSEVAANMTGNVNTFRYVLSRYMGYDLPPLPDCQLSMGNKFDLYSYTLLTQQLTGKDMANQCARYLK